MSVCAAGLGAVTVCRLEGGSAQAGAGVLALVPAGSETDSICIVVTTYLSDVHDHIVGLLKAQARTCTRCTVLCTVTEDAHTASNQTTYSTDAYDEAASDWHAAVQAARLPCPHLNIQFFPLQILPLGGCGFVLPAHSTALHAVPGDLSTSAAVSLGVRSPAS